jgi:hypothetical protein
LGTPPIKGGGYPLLSFGFKKLGSQREAFHSFLMKGQIIVDSFGKTFIQF